VALGIVWFVRPRGFAAAGVTGKPTIVFALPPVGYLSAIWWGASNRKVRKADWPPRQPERDSVRNSVVAFLPDMGP
jgi:hypothetical protein